jgi:RecA-family ATPase
VNRRDYREGTIRAALARVQSRKPAHIDTSAAQRQYEAMVSSLQPSPPNAPAANVGGSRFLAATPQEWETATLPDCIVDSHYYADVALLIGPGGVSKTTLMLDQAVSIVLGLDLYGQRVHRPGPVAIVTAEDSRKTMLYRLRKICRARNLSREQVAHVMQNVRIADVVGQTARLTKVERDVVSPNYELLLGLIDDLQTFAPAVVVFDPAVSFGVGESRVNDAEQALKNAGQCIVRALNCLVLFIHHTGKENARGRVKDAYAGRGGSAFADGARMSHVLHPMTPTEYEKATRKKLEPGQSALTLARPKGSFVTQQGEIIIRRTGFLFEHMPTGRADPSSRLLTDCEAVYQLIKFKVDAGYYPTQNSLKNEAEGLGLTHKEIGNAVAALLEQNRIERAKVETNGKGGNKSTYLRPIGDLEKPPLAKQQTETAGMLV